MGALLLAALLCAGSVSAQGQACWRQEPVLTDSAVGKAAVEGQGATLLQPVGSKSRGLCRHCLRAG